LDGVLEFVDVDVVAVLAQAAIHDALENKTHLLFKGAGVSVEQGKIEIKLLFLEQQSLAPIISQIYLKQ